jgi:DNA invertase Pin-like site-specific DNA recombinase
MAATLKSSTSIPFFIRAYLRASTDEQDANRARQQLNAFVKERGLFRLLGDCQQGTTNIALIEQVDRLSRLTANDWEKLRAEIKQRQVRVVALDLPTSWGLLNSSLDTEDFNSRMLQAVNDMMLDMLAAIARKDYDDRRRRQAQGIMQAKENGDFTGRVENYARNADILARLKRGESWSSIVKATGCSRSTLSRLRSRMSDNSISFSVYKDHADATIKTMKERMNFIKPLVTSEDLGRSLRVTIAEIGTPLTSVIQSKTEGSKKDER